MLKPKVGDMVTLKPMKVIDVEDGTDLRRAGAKIGGYFTSNWVPLEAIASIEPRPLAVGDRVQWNHPVSNFDGRRQIHTGTVRAIESDSIAVWDDSKFLVFHPSLLTRIGDA